MIDTITKPDELGIKPCWAPSKNLHFNSEGKHIIRFPEEFPVMTNLVLLHYDHKLTPNYHDYLELTYIYTGKGTFRLRNKIYNVDVGDLTVISPGELHTFEADYNHPIRLLSVFFMPELYYRPGWDMNSFELIRPILQKDTDEIDCLSPEKFSDKNLSSLFWTICYDLKKETILGNLHAKNVLSRILIELLESYFSIPASKRNKYRLREKGSDRLVDVFRFLNENFAEKITLKEASDVACMSPNYFCRYFKKITGHTFTEYLLRLRIDKAKELLLTNSYSTKKVAFLVGFENISYFYRTFHRFTSLKPSEFIEKNRNIIG